MLYRIINVNYWQGEGSHCGTLEGNFELVLLLCLKCEHVVCIGPLEDLLEVVEINGKLNWPVNLILNKTGGEGLNITMPILAGSIAISWIPSFDTSNWPSLTSSEMIEMLSFSNPGSETVSFIDFPPILYCSVIQDDI